MVQEIDFLDRLPNNWKPKTTAQRAALLCPAELMLFGGAAGSLKSSTILVDALKYHQRPRYNGILFRKSFPEIEFLIDRTRELYSNTGGTFYEGPKEWRWPWGATLKFRHMEAAKDVYKHQGPEYQWVGWDESTHNVEFPIRYLLNSRMRSADGIPLRMRLASNPGNIGHSFHKQLFMGDYCSHCLIKEAKAVNKPVDWPDDAKKPFVIYPNALWPSDRRPVNHTTCFIPGLVTDHDLFGIAGEEYTKKLKGLPEDLCRALLEGCWAAFEGQYFDCFNLLQHVVNRQAIVDLDWWPYWVGIDYGFRHITAAYLFTKAPSGHVYVIDEYIAHRRKAIDVATDLQKAWGHHNPKAWFLSPDAGRHDGTEDLSRKEQMIQASGIGFEDAYNERIGGATLIYTLLSENRISIASTCKLLVKSLASRVHSERKPEDVAKDKSEMDDAYDAFRYGAASYINPTHKPDSELLREASKDWPEDMTERIMMYDFWQKAHKSQANGFRYR